jgi:hypothetical protein
MFARILFSGLAMMTILAACSNNDNSPSNPPVSAESARTWQSVTITSACNNTTTVGTPAPSPTPNMCVAGLNKLTINADGSWNLNNGMNTGTLSADEMTLIDSGANTLAVANPASRACADAGVDITITLADEIVPKGGSSMTAYSQDAGTNRICFIGSREVALLFNTVMTDMLAKAQARPTPSPTPSASPSASPSPSATPM